MKTPNAIPQTIELNPIFSEQADSKGPSTGPRIENTEYGCAFGVLHASYIIGPLRLADAQFRYVI